jgi:transcriptional regulator with XRE-family HTH domain
MSIDRLTAALADRYRVERDRVATLYPIGYIQHMNTVLALRQQVGLTQAALARAGGTSQPTIAAYEANRKSPTIGTVQRLARAVGLTASVVFFPPLTREDRRSLTLHRAIAHRLRQEPGSVLAQARRSLATMMARQEGVSPALREWEVLLERPVEALLPLLADPAPWARELRHQTPFAGVLTAAERAEAYRAFGDDEARAA